MADYLPFKNLKFLELASVLAGPLVGSFFAELGAQVTKVENKRTNGEITRGWRHAEESPNTEESDYYTCANFNKNVELLDLSSGDDYNRLIKLVKESDVIISNFLYSTAVSLKCTFSDFYPYNNRLIFVNLVAYSKEDDRPGFDLLIQAECGYLSMTGIENHMAKMPTAMIDIIAAHQMKEAILIALYQQSKGEIKGTEISVSLYKSGLTGLINQGSSYLNSGILPIPMGTLHPSIAPYGDVFYDKNNIRFVLAVGSDKQFETMCSILNVAIDGQFIQNSLRIKNREKLYSLLQSLFSNISFEEIFNKLQLAGIPISKINDVGEALESPEAQSMIKEVRGRKKRISDIAFEFIAPLKQ
jgi:crotonobetainyl-CoA:carnitine CoA-transferase CaiB-like acyl-CoA transferase